VPRGKRVATGDLDAIVAAATTVFGRLGYRRTRMSDVAAEAGLSPGALYTYVEGKEALFHLVVSGEPATALPVPNPDPAETVAAVDRSMRAIVPTGALREAAARPGGDDPDGELRALVGEMYDAIAGARALMSVVERSARDVPGLAEQYYRRGRRRYVEDFAAFLRRRGDEGLLRTVPDAAVTARYVIETVAWFAWHRLDDPDSAMIDDGAARETVLDMATAALTVGPVR
jgi:AcrR family transcriptional regulator